MFVGKLRYVLKNIIDYIFFISLLQDEFGVKLTEVIIKIADTDILLHMSQAVF